MRPLRSWSLPHGRHAPSRARLAGRQPEPDRHALRLSGYKWTTPGYATLEAVPLMHVVPVCLAMVWQLGVVIGFLIGCPPRTRTD